MKGKLDIEQMLVIRQLCIELAIRIQEQECIKGGIVKIAKELEEYITK